MSHDRSKVAVSPDTTTIGRELEGKDQNSWYEYGVIYLFYLQQA